MENENKILETITIVCADCGKEFVMTPAEQRYYLNKGYAFPKRCAECRKARKEIINTFICVDCGKEFTVTGCDMRYFEAHNYAVPKRCKACREIKKERNLQIFAEENAISKTNE